MLNAFYYLVSRTTAETFAVGHFNPRKPLHSCDLGMGWGSGMVVGVGPRMALGLGR